MASSAKVLKTTPLDAAITTASSSTLRQIINLMCAKNDEIRKEAERQLLVKNTEISRDSENSEDSRPGEKKLVPRYAFCRACKAEFDVTQNTKESCRCHPRLAEPTGEELWVDNWDEFEVDTEEFRAELPHCFTFSCCDGNLETNPYGCVIDWHKDMIEQNLYKRPRII